MSKNTQRMHGINCLILACIICGMAGSCNCHRMNIKDDLEVDWKKKIALFKSEENRRVQYQNEVSTFEKIWDGLSIKQKHKIVNEVLLVNTNFNDLSVFEGLTLGRAVADAANVGDATWLIHIVNKMCPNYYAATPIPLILVRSKIKKPMMILLDAAQSTKSKSNKFMLMDIIRGVFGNLDLSNRNIDDDKFIEVCKTWYLQNILHLKVNMGFGIQASPEFPNGEMFAIMKGVSP